MQLKNRIRKLEKSCGEPTEDPIVFYNFVGFKEGTREVESKLGMARIVGTPFDRIRSHEDETDIEFTRRIYAIKAGGKLIEDMTEAEREAAYAAADQRMKDEGDDD